MSVCVYIYKKKKSRDSPWSIYDRGNATPVDPLMEIRSQQLSGMFRVVRRFAGEPSSGTYGRRGGRRRRYETVQFAVDYYLIPVPDVVSIQLLVRI